MKTLQEKYNAVLEGNFPKSQFVRDAKMEVPRFISPFNGFEDTVQILKNKGMLVEAKAETPEYDKPAPGYPLEALERGVDYELEKMGLMSNETVSEEDYAKAKKKAEKNLEKDVNHYLHILSGDSKKVDKHDREVEVDQKKLFKGTVDPKGGKAEGNTDTFNAMKKATLREAAMAKGYTKEQVEAAIKRLQEKKENKVDEAAKETSFSSDEIKSVSFPNGLSVTVGEEHPEEEGIVIGIEKGENGYLIMFQDGSEGGGYHVDFDGEFLDEDDFIEENKGNLNERTDIVPTAELKASAAFKDAGIDMNEPVLVLTQDGGHGEQETKGTVSAQEALKMFQRLRAEGMKSGREDHYEFDNEIDFHAEGYEYKLSYFEEESTTTALMQKATVSENKAKLNEELAPTGIGISGDQLDKLNKLGAIAGVEVTVQDKDGSNVRKVDYTLTNTSFEKDIDDYDSIAEGDIKEAVKKVIKHVLSEGALDRFSDYEPEISNRTETIQDILGELEQELDVNIDIINGQISKTGGALSPAIQAATKKDLMELVKTYVEKITYVKSQPVDIDGKRLHSIPSVKPLNERVGSLDDFLSLIKDRAVDSEFSEKQEAEEVIEALADHYNIESQSGGDENKDAIKFAQFIHAHGLNDEEIKDEEYLKTLYNNYKENK